MSNEQNVNKNELSKDEKMKILKKWNIVKEYDCEIITLMILEKYQRKGLGIQLMHDMVIQLKKDLKIQNFMVATGFQNLKARSFYQDKLKGEFVAVVRVHGVLCVYGWNVEQFLTRCQQIQQKRA